MQFLKRFKKDESGATAIEYGLIAALIAVVLITIFSGSTEPVTASDELVMKVTDEVVPND